MTISRSTGVAVLFSVALGCSSGGGDLGADAAAGSDGGGSETGSQFGVLDVDGAQKASHSLDDDDAITCRIEGDTLRVEAAPAGASGEGLTLVSAGYTGPGLYSTTAGSTDTEVTVEIAGGYVYELATDPGDGEGISVATSCELIVVDIPTVPGFIDVTFSCEDLIAADGSADASELDATGHRPRVQLAAHVVCET